jgi:hypothetical protein
MGIKFFQWPNLVATKIFNDQPYDNPKFSNSSVATSKNILIAPQYGD